MQRIIVDVLPRVLVNAMFPVNRFGNVETGHVTSACQFRLLRITEGRALCYSRKEL